MNEETKQAIHYIANNKIICDQLALESRKQVAFDVRAKTGSGTTDKAIELLLASGNDKTISERFTKYLAAGFAAAVALRLDATA